MIKPSDIEGKGWDRYWARESVRPGQEAEAGWYPVNSVNPRDCIPSYRLPGGGVTKDELYDLPEAIDRSRANLASHIATATTIIKKLESLKHYIEGGDFALEQKYKRVRCECDQGMPCPQGRVGSDVACVIWVRRDHDGAA